VKRFHLHSLPIAALIAALPSLAAAQTGYPGGQPTGYQPGYGGYPYQPTQGAGYPAQPGGWGYPQQQTYQPPAQPTYSQPAQQPSYPSYSQPPSQPSYGQPQYAQPGYGQPYTQPQTPGYPFGQQPGYGQPQQSYPGPQGFPGQPWAPQQQPSYGYGSPYGQTQQPGRPVSNQQPPKVELQMESSRAYVQQSLLLTLEVISGSVLKTANPEPPRTSDVVFKRLGEAVAIQRGNEIVNQFHFALTPLREGQFTLPPIKVSGTYSAGGEFEAESSSVLQLNVIPADSSIQPWLPLHGLVIQGYLDGDQNPAAGKPISLVVDTSAVGTTGQQLPSLEQQLKVPDFRVYREKTETTGKVSQDGKFLIGTRTETFTLVPLHGGRVQIPTLQLHWWNVDTSSAEVSSVPIRQLMARGEPGVDDGRVTDLFPGATKWILWPALIALFAVPFGIWTLAWLRHKTFVQVMGEEMAIANRFFWGKIAGFLRWLAPIRRAQRLRQIFVRRGLPKSWRLWFCVKLVNQENDPETWAYMLRFLANKHLGLPPQDSMTVLGDRIANIHPKCKKEVMRDLMGQLDAALYHRGEIDFPRWKRQFRSQLRPGIFGGSREPRAAPKQPRGLPMLNPSIP